MGRVRFTTSSARDAYTLCVACDARQQRSMHSMHRCHHWSTANHKSRKRAEAPSPPMSDDAAAPAAPVHASARDRAKAERRARMAAADAERALTASVRAALRVPPPDRSAADEALLREHAALAESVGAAMERTAARKAREVENRTEAEEPPEAIQRKVPPRSPPVRTHRTRAVAAAAAHRRHSPHAGVRARRAAPRCAARGRIHRRGHIHRRRHPRLPRPQRHVDHSQEGAKSRRRSDLGGGDRISARLPSRQLPGAETSPSPPPPRASTISPPPRAPRRPASNSPRSRRRPRTWGWWRSSALVTCHTSSRRMWTGSTSGVISAISRRYLGAYLPVSITPSRSRRDLGRSGLPPSSLTELHGNVFKEWCTRCGAVYLRGFDVAERSS